MAFCITKLVLSNHNKICPSKNNFILTTQATLRTPTYFAERRQTVVSSEIHFKIQSSSTGSIFRSSRSLIIFKIGVLKNCALITRKCLCWSLLLINLRAWVIESYWNSLVCLVGLMSGIITKTIWNCIIVFFRST